MGHVHHRTVCVPYSRANAKLSKLGFQHSLNSQARARTTQALQRLEVSALFITSRTMSHAFTRWCQHAKRSTQKLRRFCHISSRFDISSRKRRQRYALRQWRTVVSAYRADREGRRVHAHERAVSQLAFQQRLLRTCVGRGRCRQLFSTWRGWLLTRNNAKLTSQLQKLRVKYQHEQQAEGSRRLSAAIHLVVTSVRRVACTRQASAFRHWHALATFSQQQRAQTTLQLQQRKACLRSIVVRNINTIKARAWRLWMRFHNHELATLEQEQMESQLAGRDRRLKAVLSEHKRTLERIFLTRCCTAYTRVTRFWLRTALHRWVSTVEAAQKRA